MQKPAANSNDNDARYVASELGDLADGLDIRELGVNSVDIDPDDEQRVRQKWQQVRCYGFECGGYRFIAPLNVYCELLTQVKIERLPNTPDHFLGLSNVRGNLVPVYQLESLLEQPSISTRYALVIGKLEQAAALIVAGKPKPFDLRDFVQSEPTTSLPDFLQTAVSAFYQRDDETWYLLNHVQLFKALANLLSSSSPSMSI